jgi:hypothetical protein
MSMDVASAPVAIAADHNRTLDALRTVLTEPRWGMTPPIL